MYNYWSRLYCLLFSIRFVLRSNAIALIFALSLRPSREGETFRSQSLASCRPLGEEGGGVLGGVLRAGGVPLLFPLKSEAVRVCLGSGSGFRQNITQAQNLCLHLAARSSLSLSSLFRSKAARYLS